jgi:hypothetical protein
MIFGEIVIPMDISIAAKFYCFMTTRFLTADIQIVKKRVFFGTICIRKSGITFARLEIQSSFYAHFKANKMPFPMNYYANIFSTVMFLKSSYLTFDLVFIKNAVFYFF